MYLWNLIEFFEMHKNGNIGIRGLCTGIVKNKFDL